MYYKNRLYVFVYNIGLIILTVVSRPSNGNVIQRNDSHFSSCIMNSISAVVKSLTVSTSKTMGHH